VPLEDGSVIGFAIEPTYKLVRLPASEMARFAATPVTPNPRQRFQSAVSRLLTEFASIEQHADALIRAGGANGAGNGVHHVT
jgi:hypothetical protein